jgi:hypothetical protein
VQELITRYVRYVTGRSFMKHDLTDYQVRRVEDYLLLVRMD